MKKAGYIISVLVFIFCAVLFLFYTADHKGGNIGSQKREESKITSVTGSLEADETDLNVKVPGKVKKIYVEEGQEVFAGQVVAKIEADNIEAKVKQAEAVLEIAKAKYQQAQIALNAQKEQSESTINQAQALVDASQAQLSKAKGGARPQQVAQAKELVDQAQKGYDLSKSTYERLFQLYKDGLIPQQKIDMAKTDMDVSQAKLNTAQQQYDLVKEGAQKEDIQAAQAVANQAQATLTLAKTSKLQVDAREQDVEAARAQVIQAQATLDEAKSYLNDSSIKAPVSGIITMRSVDNGEMVGTGMPVVTISNLKSIWVNLKVKETELNKYTVGDKVKVKVAGVPNKIYTGKVTYISAKPSYATERATQEKGERDIVSFAVKIKLKNDDMKLRPGMTAVVLDSENTSDEDF